MAETSDVRFLNMCRRLLDIFEADQKWNPSNPILDISLMRAKLNNGYLAAADVQAKFAPQKIKINHRQAVYAKFKPMVRASRNYLKSSGASKAEINDAQTYIRTLLGERAVPKPAQNPDATADTAEKFNSVSRMSFDSQYGNLAAYRQYLGNVAAYDPNEIEVNLMTVDALLQEADASNIAVSEGFVPLLKAWNLRDFKLYTAEDSILNDFRAAKDYYKSLYPANTPEAKAVAALKLRDNSRV